MGRMDVGAAATDPSEQLTPESEPMHERYRSLRVETSEATFVTGHIISALPKFYFLVS
jgi:hypothetical protein